MPRAFAPCAHDAPFGEPSRQAAPARRVRDAQQAQRRPGAWKDHAVRLARREVKDDRIEVCGPAYTHDLGVGETTGGPNKPLAQARPLDRSHSLGVVGIGLDEDTPDGGVVRLRQTLDHCRALERNVVVELGLAGTRGWTSAAATAGCRA